MLVALALARLISTGMKTAYMKAICSLAVVVDLELTKILRANKE